ncbi:hypothetical protein, partial [Bradyrhizobium sp. 23]|uniref:hypothetical protein n=1 Tax=Bradyrhizobium sp. 23 TaxID=2782667 RepID=UPI001FFBB61F
SETSVQAGGFFRTFIRILKQGYRLRAYREAALMAADLAQYTAGKDEDLQRSSEARRSSAKR